MRLFYLFSLCSILFLPASVWSQVYVDIDANGNNDGTSWTDAFNNLQDALNTTPSGEIWVAKGLYKPIQCTTCDMDDRSRSFQLNSNQRIYGGFAGTESALEERDFLTNTTILSGDIGALSDSTDNSFNVVVAKDCNANTVLDGFIIEEGNADGSFGFSAGGGILINAQGGLNGDLTIRNCTIRNNYAGGGGGIAIDCVLGGISRAVIRDCLFEGNTASLGVVSTGAAIFMQGNSGAIIEPQIINCIFQNNFCGNDGGAISMTPTGAGTILATQIDSCQFLNNIAADRGAGIWYRMSSEGQKSVKISNSRFEGNEAGGQGGAIYTRSSFDNIATDTIINCWFAENTATGTSTINEGEGGAIFIRGSQAGTQNQEVVNCAFFRNYAAQRGGAIGTTSFVSNAGMAKTNVTNCTFYGNKTDGRGGAIHAESSQGSNAMVVTNSILWADTATVDGPEIWNNNASITVSHTDIDADMLSGITDGGNNIVIDPMFADAPAGDLRLLGCSPLLNFGDNAALPAIATTDLDGDNRIHAGIVDLGAYEVGVIYVDEDATAGADNGRSWADAYLDLQDALARAASADQIWVAEGTYLPVSCAPCDEQDRRTFFDIAPNTELYGGFNATEALLEERDWQAHPTILSGDIGTPVDSTDNAYRVIIAQNSTDKTMLDGFIVEEGNADGSFGFSAGGGLLLDAQNNGTAHLQIRHCTFRNNYAGGGGGLAIDCVLGGRCEAFIDDCTFEGNTASLEIVSTGAGIFMQGNSGAFIAPLIKNSHFENNFSGNDGGAISMTPTGEGSVLATRIDSCTFVNNRSSDRGAGIWYRMSSFGETRVVISNSRFENNQAGGQGAGIYARSSFDNIANDTIVNCTFVQNGTDGSSTINDGEGGAIFLRASQDGIRDQHIINCIFDRNFAQDRGGAIATSSIVASAGTCNSNLINCTFYGNSTEGEGRAIHNEASEGSNTMLITNSIFWEDTSSVAGPEILNNGANLTISNTDLAGGLPDSATDGGNILDVDPQFVDPINGDLRLSACSPVLDIGDNSAIPADNSDLDNDGDQAENIDIDLIGEARIFNDLVDFGAYEYNGTPSAISLSLGFTAVSCHSFCDGSASVEVMDGVPDYSIRWSNGQETNIITDLCAGTYSLTVTDSRNCRLVDSVIVEENAAITLTATADTTICPGEMVSLSANAEGGTDNFTYAWDNGLGMGPDQSVMPTESIAYELTVEDGNGCSRTDTVNITVTPAPQSEIMGQPGFCEGQSTTLDAGAFATYLWSNGEETPEVEIMQSGNIGVTVTDEEGCTGSAEVTIEEFPNPQPDISGTTSFCPGGSTLLEGPAGFEAYLWSDGSMEPSLEVNTPGLFGLTVTDTNGCEGTDEVEIAELPSPEPMITGALSFCESESTTLAAGDFESYHWSTDATTPQIEVMQGGTVAVTVTNAEGCEGSAEVDVTANPNPEPEIVGSTTFCTGANTTLQGPDGLEDYLWSDGSMEPSIVVDMPGTIGLTVTDANGCMGSAQVEVSESDELEPSITGELSFCEGESSILEVGNFDSYLWSTAEETAQISVIESGTIAITVTDASGCMGTDEVTITVFENPVPEIAGSTTFCAGSNTVLMAPAGFADYLWSDDSALTELLVETPGTIGLTVTDANGCSGSVQVEVSESDELDPIITGALSFCEGESTGLSAGIFENYEWSTGEETAAIDVAESGTFSVTVSDSGGCTGEASVEVSSLPLPEPDITGATTICADSTTLLLAPLGFEEYLWSDGSTMPELEVSASGSYSLSVTDTNACTGSSTVAVSVITGPTALPDNFTILAEDDRDQVYDILDNDQFGQGGWTFELLTAPDLGSVALLGDSLVSFTAPPRSEGVATFAYQLCAVECPEACSQAVVRITIESDDSPLPNGITPNDDGVNDTFVFDELLLNPPDAFPDNRLIIFNRWGDIVFEQAPYDNSWDGRSDSGQDLPEGTYYYVLYLDIGEGLLYRGDVTVIR